MAPITIPSGFLSYFPLIRGQESCQKQAGIPHRGRRQSKGAMKKFQLTSTLSIQTRPAQRVNEDFGQVIRAACESDSAIQTCFLIDARNRESKDEFLIIAITSENGDFDSIAEKFQGVFEAFPERLPDTCLMSSDGFEGCRAGSEFYNKHAEHDENGKAWPAIS